MIAPRGAASTQDPLIEPLLVSKIGALRLWLGSRFSESTLSDHLALNPGLSWRAARNGQYLVGGFWRRRPEIAGIVELATGEYRRELVERMIASARDIGCELAVAEAADGDRAGELWLTLGFEPLEHVVEYERAGSFQAEPPSASLRRYTPDDLFELMTLERRSFPWLWWNSTAEMARYGEASESEIWVMDRAGGGLAAYVGLTFRGGHGHLDRLAVAPELRRRGIGRQLVAHSIGRFAERRVGRVTLTTQHDNVRAQPLYSRFGFRQTNYRLTIYGLWLGRPRDRTP